MAVKLYHRVLILTAMAVSLFSSCSKQEEDELQGMARVQFSLSLDADLVATKASDAVVQVGGWQAFRGITDITLLPFQTHGAILSTDERLGFCEGLSDIESTSLSTAGNHGMLYQQQMIPYKTSSLLFYGKAKPLSANKAREGSLIPYGLEGMQPSSILFSPETIGVPGYAANVANILTNHLTNIATLAGFQSTYPELFHRFTNGGELMSGSSESIRLLLTDLYRSVAVLPESELSLALLHAIINTEYMDYTSAQGVVFKSVLSDKYPGASLPEGAAALRWNGERFLIGDSTGALLAPLNRYCYPIGLWYYANSTIRTTEEETYGDIADAFDTQASWDGVLGFFEKNNNASIGHKTVAVAMNEPVRYAMGMLELTLKKVTASTLMDHAGYPVNVNNYSFPVTGIILGGQRAQLYNFTASSGEDYYVYDTRFDAEAYMSSYADEVTLRTLALESAKEAVIHFAIELKNDSASSFVGATGVVLPGSKFYLLGELDLDTLSDEARTIKGVKRTKVFEKYYRTLVSVRMASLKDAYTIIPDLRQPQLQLGLIVDFDWAQSTPTNVPIY